MNSQPARREAWWSLLLGIVALVILSFIFAQTLKGLRDRASLPGTPLVTSNQPGAGVQALISTPTPYPTDYPPAKRTLEERERRTQQAALLTPFPTGTVWLLPPSTNTPSPEELTPVPVPATPAGAGAIVDNLPIAPSLAGVLGIKVMNKWFEVTSNGELDIFAGALVQDTSQGVIYVAEFSADGRQLLDGGYYETPVKAGPVRIVDAQGERLILLSENGTTFYFDLPGQTFVSSLSEVVPTATRAPTLTPEPTNTPAFADDVPDRPGDIRENSLVNTNLSHFISPAHDVDWFRFHAAITGTIQVHLDNLPVNYDLSVFSATSPQLRGSSINSGNTAELVTVTNVPPDDYYVQVVGVNGAWDAVNPYQLRFEMLGEANIWVGLKNSDDIGIRFDLRAEVYRNGTQLAGSGEVASVPGGSSGFNNARRHTITITPVGGVSFVSGDSLSLKLSVRNACSGSGKNSGTARLWYGDAAADSGFFNATFGNPAAYYLLSGFTLGTTPGPGPKLTIDVPAGAKCSSYKEFGTWSITLP